MKRERAHQWYKPGQRPLRKGRVCGSCGLQRRIKPGTRTTWQYRFNGESWATERAPYCLTSRSAVTTPEPAPVRTDSPAVWPLVIADAPRLLDETRAAVVERLTADMTARDADGRRKYGVPLQVENGRDPAVDAYQGALDLTVYARQQWERYNTRIWWRIYEDALGLAARICAELMDPCPRGTTIDAGEGSAFPPGVTPTRLKRSLPR